MFQYKLGQFGTYLLFFLYRTLLFYKVRALHVQTNEKLCYSPALILSYLLKKPTNMLRIAQERPFHPPAAYESITKGKERE
jgi:hypothetical protein